MKRIRALLAALVLLSLTALYGLVNARVVRLKSVNVEINGLDARLEGVNILLVSDLNMASAADARRCAALLRRLCAAEPEILIICGGLTAPAGDAEVEKREAALQRFFSGTTDIRLEGGKYVVYGGDDLLIPDSYINGSGWTRLSGGQKKLYLRGAGMALVGYDGAQTAARSFSFDDAGTGLCIVAAHDPEISRLLPFRCDENGTPYADLFLCGKTLGGQIKLLGRPLINPRLALEYAQELMTRLTIPVVVSQGIGSKYLPLRYGTRATAYLIELRRRE